jgi:hypothetical protein
MYMLEKNRLCRTISGPSVIDDLKMSEEQCYNRDTDCALRDTSVSATLFTINPTRSGRGQSRGVGGERQATNCLSHSTAHGKTHLRVFCHIRCVFESELLTQF